MRAFCRCWPSVASGPSSSPTPASSSPTRYHRMKKRRDIPTTQKATCRHSRIERLGDIHHTQTHREDIGCTCQLDRPLRYICQFDSASTSFSLPQCRASVSLLSVSVCCVGAAGHAFDQVVCVGGGLPQSALRHSGLGARHHPRGRHSQSYSSGLPWGHTRHRCHGTTLKGREFCRKRERASELKAHRAVGLLVGKEC